MSVGEKKNLIPIVSLTFYKLVFEKKQQNGRVTLGLLMKV